MLANSATLDQHEHTLNQLMEELNGRDRLCPSELTAAYIVPFLEAVGKVIRYVDPLDKVMTRTQNNIQHYVTGGIK